MKIAMIGYNEGNGHPFSFSSIINDYNNEEFSKTEWTGIQAYLNKQPKNAFGFPDVKVTHAWTPYDEITDQLCKACHIQNPIKNLRDIDGQVDAIIIATDDYQQHLTLAKPFLEKGYPVFIDKPLTLTLAELNYFMPYIENGMLMTTSGLRYAVELNSIRTNPNVMGEIKLINGVVVNGFEKYGIHLLDAISGLDLGIYETITRLPTHHDAFLIEMSGGIKFILSCLESIVKTFHLGIYGSQASSEFDLLDNFSAFRGTLDKFVSMVRTKTPPIDPKQIYRNIELLIKASSLKQNETLELSLS